MAPTSMSPQQLHALFDVLTHQQAYSEIQRFKYPTGIKNYGPPFDDGDSNGSSSPLLQTLLYRFILGFPGIKDLSPDFWEKRCQPLIEKLAAAELSESYDKGTIGSRRTLATAFSTLLEYPARGCLGGLQPAQGGEVNRNYDIQEPEDVLDAWDVFVQEVVHGDMIDQLFTTISETDKLDEQSTLVQSAHEYLLVNLASFLHYTVVLSPDGPYIARIAENINKLVPYTLMRQTLRVGNAATMINGMTRLLLTKLSVNGITSYFGLTKPSDSGMNMLQQIASTVITWDVAELQRQTAAIEKDKEGPSKEHFEAIKEHMRMSREEREEQRLASQKDSKSIVAIIFEQSGLSLDLSDSQHAQALDYLSIQLSIRDREHLSKIICSQSPDLVTQAVRDFVAAYTEILRKVHATVDLSANLTAFELFMADFVELSTRGLKSSAPSTRPHTPESSADSVLTAPSVVDFVKLLKKHQGAAHRFLHEVAKKCPEVTQMYRDYIHSAAAHFRSSKSPEKPADSSNNAQLHSGAGMMTEKLQKMFSELPEESRQAVSDALDNRAAYLFALYCASRDRMRSALEDDKAARTGPGIYLVKWQQLLDITPITPASPIGPVRTGKDPSVKEKAGVGVDSSAKDRVDNSSDGLLGDIPNPPDYAQVVELLGPKFQEIVANIGKQQWTS